MKSDPDRCHCRRSTLLGAFDTMNHHVSPSKLSGFNSSEWLDGFWQLERRAHRADCSLSSVSLYLSIYLSSSSSSLSLLFLKQMVDLVGDITWSYVSNQSCYLQCLHRDLCTYGRVHYSLHSIWNWMVEWMCVLDSWEGSKRWWMD